MRFNRGKIIAVACKNRLVLKIILEKNSYFDRIRSLESAIPVQHSYQLSYKLLAGHL